MSLYLDPKLVPNGTGLPISAEALIALVAQYTSVEGLGTFTGVNYGLTIPATADQQKPWMKLNADGESLGWWIFEGSAWKSVKPIGEITHMGHLLSTAPAGYALCNGTGTYTPYGMSAQPIPDLRNKVIAGAGDDTGYYTTLEEFGADNVTPAWDLPAETGEKQLSNLEIPEHDHIFFAGISTEAGGAPGFTQISTEYGMPLGTGANWPHYTYETNQGGSTPTATGAGDAFTMTIGGTVGYVVDVRQPSLAAPAIIWTGV